MSRSVDLFIQTDLAVGEAAAAIASRTGLRVGAQTAEGGVELAPAEGGVRAVLHEHPFVGDDELLLSRYRYALTAEASGEGPLGDAPETRLLRKVASTVAADLPALLVLDLQYKTRHGSAGTARHGSAGTARHGSAGTARPGPAGTARPGAA